MKLLFLIIILSLSFTIVFGQLNPNQDRQTVLKNNNIGKAYVFDRSKKDSYNKTEITYLGKLTTTDGRIFKILISRWYWGFSPRATSAIIVFNDKDQYLGNYYVTMTYDLPTKIEKNALVFDNEAKKDCDPKIATRISFINGLPKEFFIECKNKLGDIYTFSAE